MNKQELAKWIERSRSLFAAGIDNDEIYAAMLRRLTFEDARRCDDALTDYAVTHAGPGRRFVPGVYLQHLAMIPDRSEALRGIRDEQTRIAARAAEADRVSAEWRRMRDRCERLAPEQLEEVRRLLAACGWMLPESASQWSRSMVWAVTAILDAGEVPESIRSGTLRMPRLAQG